MEKISMHFVRTAGVLPAVVFAAALNLLTGCAMFAVPNPQITDKTWMLIELHGQPIVSGPDQRQPQLRLVAEGERLAGNTGCNSLAGSYRLEADQIHLPQPLMMTRMACLDPRLAEQEQAFVAAVTTAERVILEAGELVLLQDGKELARFTASTD